MPNSASSLIYASIPHSRTLLHLQQISAFMLDIMSQLELGKPEPNGKPEKRVNGIFWIILLNIGISVADHFFQLSLLLGTALAGSSNHNMWPRTFPVLLSSRPMI
ncbi:hypothetical protein GLYMA_14G142000v4 [Glycine max]|uniref:Uncharacterized protein n=2 Tax=Glycine subgen. Soja TaxID=1462606 RepID=K7M6Q0_SOYBN|nr:hypothetical protein JHK87_039800 [Glycine soja]KAG4963131.1 hypothetical protein JHK86_039999 [Glycine max]KAG4965598.1 hypothetical protein JHK85_040573 [Glycine max]KAG5121868.1 hypothetical protein JHK84_040208 [Glycine max]KAH1094464.1 hypothetical protein GYH30_039947 [Glycine max]